jgi:4-hydroxythreonine-4-phosphate dehydrogenase
VRRAPPDFIFMLTNRDRTIPDARDRLREALAAGVTRIGFKDIGLSFDDMKALAETIREAAGVVYLEVVSLDAVSERRSAEAALELRVDILMGGSRPKVVLPIISGSKIRYYPFPGRIDSHPSVLNGPIEAIVESSRRLAIIPGVHGLDLLAYRFVGDAPRLIREVRQAADPKPIVVAGSIDRRERIEAIVAGQASAFTIGTAALEGAFAAGSKSLSDQLRVIRTIVEEAAKSADQSWMPPKALTAPPACP